MGFSLSQGPFTYNRFNLNEGAKPDFLDMDKDGNKKESFKKAVKDKKDCGCKKETDCDCSDKKKEVKEEKKELPPFLQKVMGKDKDDKKDKKKKSCDESVSITKEDVLNHLIENNYVNNVVSAEAMFNHITDEFLEVIEDSINEAYQQMSPKATEMSKRRSANLSDQEYKAAGTGNEKKTNNLMQKKIAVMDARGRHGARG